MLQLTQMSLITSNERQQGTTEWSYYASWFSRWFDLAQSLLKTCFVDNNKMRSWNFITGSVFSGGSSLLSLLYKTRVGQHNRCVVYGYNVYMDLLAVTPPYIRSCTVCVHGPGPCTHVPVKHFVHLGGQMTVWVFYTVPMYIICFTHVPDK
jgi:hypothetical protein